MPRSTASATTFTAALGSSFITTMPPKPMMERCSPVLPSGRRAMGFDGVADVFASDARMRLAVATAAVMAACFRKLRRSIIYLRGGCAGQRAQLFSHREHAGERSALRRRDVGYIEPKQHQ